MAKKTLTRTAVTLHLSTSLGLGAASPLLNAPFCADLGQSRLLPSAQHLHLHERCAFQRSSCAFVCQALTCPSGTLQSLQGDEERQCKTPSRAHHWHGSFLIISPMLPRVMEFRFICLADFFDVFASGA